MLTDIRAPNRQAPTWRQMVDPLWWALDAAKPAHYSHAGWFLRNPFCNFLSVVVGVAHRERSVTVLRGVGWTFTDGVNSGWSVPIGGMLPRPFVSFRAFGLEGVLGWKTSGGLGASLRSANAKGPQ